MVRRILISLAICFLYIDQALCADIVPKPWPAHSIMSGTFVGNAKTRKGRQIIAQSLLDQLIQLNAFIPNLKPSELEWLANEEREINKLEVNARQARFLKFHVSPVKHVNHLKLMLNAVIYSLNNIVRNNSITLKEEMASWGHIVLILISYHFNVSLNVLTHHKVIILTYDIKRELGLCPLDECRLWDFYLGDAGPIQQYIVLPYLRGEIDQ